MFVFHPKPYTIVGLIILVAFSVGFVGCGDSKSVETLNAHLTKLSKFVEDYEATVAKDQSKKAEWDAKMDEMVAKWTDLRNEYGTAITPQDMDKLVKQYDNLMLGFKNFKKTTGS
jgi:hypothetical protein